jgi:hypothetical protein
VITWISIGEIVGANLAAPLLSASVVSNGDAQPERSSHAGETVSRAESVKRRLLAVDLFHLELLAFDLVYLGVATLLACGLIGTVRSACVKCC